MNVLMVVESPNKAKKIRGYFPEFDVLATVGHFMDLPQDKMGVEPPEHTPEWEVMKDKQQVITSLRAAAKTADVIYLATDPDREGEAIAGHVANTLGKIHAPKISRITYVEISKPAIEKAIHAKRAIDWPLVRAQEARRVLDRYVGYLVSPELTHKLKAIGNKNVLSAGRVQTVALKLVVERHADINQFVSIQHFGVTAQLLKNGIAFSATWKPALKSGELLLDKQIANAVIERTTHLTVAKVQSNPRRVVPPKPLMTSSYVRLMGATLKLTTKQAMDAAQKLFEQGLITYHRTDSPTMSMAFVETLRAFATRHTLALPSTPRDYHAGANAQQGHECLRVTDINLINIRAAGVEDPLLLSVYPWIWKITLESQLAEGVDQETLITFENTANELFIARAKCLKEWGWRAAANQFGHSQASQTATDLLDCEVDAEEKVLTKLPELNFGESLKPIALECVTKHTKPPEAYTEKTLVEKLDQLGIGRPSTYAQTIERIIAMHYVSRHAKTLRMDPLPQGIAVVTALDTHFSFMRYEYTAELESAFDKIAHRNAEFLNVVHDAWQALSSEVELFKRAVLPVNVLEYAGVISYSNTDTEKGRSKKESGSQPKAEPRKTVATKKVERTFYAPGDQCPTCQKGVVHLSQFKHGTHIGKSFKGCSQFPRCRYFAWAQ
jgi:DNA topoisomerase I